MRYLDGSWHYPHGTEGEGLGFGHGDGEVSGELDGKLAWASDAAQGPPALGERAPVRFGQSG
jgi:hypothetical protein